MVQKKPVLCFLTRFKLTRTIICICNDLWAPSLKQLREVARVYKFVPAQRRVMTKRLSDICRSEGMSPEHSSITQIVDLVDGDIRSALNTLQFMQVRTRLPLVYADLA